MRNATVCARPPCDRRYSTRRAAGWAEWKRLMSSRPVALAETRKGQVAPTRPHIADRSGTLLTQGVDEFDQLDGLVVVHVCDRLPGLVLAVGEFLESFGVLLRRLKKRLLDRRLHVVRQITEIGGGRVDDEVGLHDDA